MKTHRTSRLRRASFFGLTAAISLCGAAGILGLANAAGGVGSVPAKGHAAPPSGEQARKGGAPDVDALLPTSVRVHPLTRFVQGGSVDEDGGGAVQIACHIELRDQFGHVVKGLGTLRVELYRPRAFQGAPVDAPGGPGGVGEIQERVWEVDLSDPAENAAQYDDFVTRTYLLYLSGVPDWVQRWAASKPASARSGADDAPLVLKAYFVLKDSKGKEHRLEHSGLVAR